VREKQTPETGFETNTLYCIDLSNRQKWQEKKLVSKFDEKTFEDSSSFLQNQN
jgi:hypothetical protein